jgi:hypothetical protein
MLATSPGDAGPNRVGRTTFVDRIDADAVSAILAHLRDPDSPTAVVQLRVLGGAMGRVHPDLTAFAHRAARLMVNVATIYDRPDELRVRQEWLTDVARAIPHGNGAAVGFLGDDGPAHIREAYPPRTWERLVEIKRRYDPGNLFRLNQNVAPGDLMFRRRRSALMTAQRGSPSTSEHRRLGRMLERPAEHAEQAAQQRRGARQAEASTAGSTVPSLLGTPAGHLLKLQRTAGNVAVRSLLQRRPVSGSAAAPAPSTTAGVHVQRDDDEATGIERIREIHKNTWVGPLDEYELEEEWSKLGPDGAAQYPKEFNESIQYGMEPDNLEGADEVLSAFQQGVKEVALDYLSGNRADIDKEAKSLGLGNAQPTAEQQANVAEVMVLAEKAKQLDELAKSYGQIQVGYEHKYVRDRMDPEHKGMVLEEVPATFKPGGPPEIGLKGNEGRGAKRYEEVAASYSQTMGGLMAIANKHPVIYAALKSGDLGPISGGTDGANQDPATAMKTVLEHAKAAIAETEGNIRNDSITWDELKPIHGQLMRGERFAGGKDWTSVWNQAIVKDEIGDVETADTLIDVGIGLAAAMAFIFSEIATGGAATIFWAGAGLALGGGNAARKWNNYAELKAAAAAGTSQASELISADQVTAAAIDAIIETAFFFLDAAGAAVKGVKGAAALGVKRAGETAAKDAANLTALQGLKSAVGEDAARIASQGIDQLGVTEAAKAAGMSVDDLLKKVPADSAAASKIKAFLAVAEKGVEPAQLAAAVRDAVGGKAVVGRGGATLTAEEVIKQAFDTLGVQGTIKEAGSWKSLGAALGPTSEVGQRLKAWRDAVNTDLKKFIESLRTSADGDAPLIQETGTLDNVTNDLDISFLGPNASQNKMKAAQFLGGRTGFGADPGLLDKMVYIGLFTDPRRMHLFDQFPEIQAKLAERTMKFEEELIWNDEYAKYLLKSGKGGAEGEAARRLATQIGQEMDALGVKKIPGFRPLSDRAVDVLTKDMDRLHAAAEAAAKAGDVGRLESLVEEMSNIQAQINVKEGGGYFTAGGVRKFVTDKEGFPGARQAVTAAHDLGAALDQVGKLRKAISAFEAEALKVPATRDATELAKHIKDLAKYGDRFSAASEVLGSQMPSPAVFNEMASEFAELILLARGASVHTMQDLLAKNMDGVIRKTQVAIAGFDKAHVEVLMALRARAGIEGVGDLAPDILRATKARYAFLTFQSALITQMGAAARAAGIPIQHAVRDDAETGTTEQSTPQMGDFPVPDKATVPA